MFFLSYVGLLHAPVVLQDSKTLLPGMDPVQMLRTNPDMVLSLVKGKHMVPYDQVCAHIKTLSSITVHNQYRAWNG
jgi:hypothetical protein